MVSPTRLASIRYKAELEMSETITAGPYTETVGDDLVTTRTLDSTTYAGKAQVEYPTLNVSERTAAGQQVSVAEVVVKLPVSAALIPVGQLIVVSASTVDAGLVAREFRVTAKPASGAVSCHRYPVKELN